MKLNIPWTATKLARLQIRFAFWTFDTLMGIGYVLRNLRKYHKIDPWGNPYVRRSKHDAHKLELHGETFDEYLDRLDKYITEADKQYGV